MWFLSRSKGMCLWLQGIQTSVINPQPPNLVFYILTNSHPTVAEHHTNKKVQVKKKKQRTILLVMFHSFPSVQASSSRISQVSQVFPKHKTWRTLHTWASWRAIEGWVLHRTGPHKWLHLWPSESPPFDQWKWPFSSGENGQKWEEYHIETLMIH